MCVPCSSEEIPDLGEPSILAKQKAIEVAIFLEQVIVPFTQDSKSDELPLCQQLLAKQEIIHP